MQDLATLAGLAAQDCGTSAASSDYADVSPERADVESNTDLTIASTDPPCEVLPTMETCGDVTTWTYPDSFSQSTLHGQNGSNACTLIALYMGHLHNNHRPPFPDNTDRVLEWTRHLEQAIRLGNGVHDDVFDSRAVNLSCEEGISLIGEDCHVNSESEPASCLGDDCAEQLARVLSQSSEQAVLHSGCLPHCSFT